MAFKTCITVVAVVYAVQLLCGAHESSHGSHSTSLSEEDPDNSAAEYPEYYYDDGTCTYPAIHVPDNKTLALNCTANCFKGRTAVLNDTIPCVNATTPSLTSSIQRYNCTVGFCLNGTCPSNHTVLPCWMD
uniref:Evasin n=1 Tax=Rhipicephalus pulchellus TaxID=72859 RepID=L7MA80_RHIPC